MASGDCSLLLAPTNSPTVLMRVLAFALFIGTARAHFPLATAASAGPYFATRDTALEASDVTRSQSTSRIATCGAQHIRGLKSESDCLSLSSDCMHIPWRSLRCARVHRLADHPYMWVKVNVPAGFNTLMVGGTVPVIERFQDVRWHCIDIIIMRHAILCAHNLCSRRFVSLWLSLVTACRLPT